MKNNGNNIKLDVLKKWAYNYRWAEVPEGTIPLTAADPDYPVAPVQQIKEGARESMCNPAMQAKLLEEAGVEFNVSMGLCVGHDAIFNHASSVPVTVLVAKDRVLAHNPLGAIYSRYWLKKLGIYEEEV